MEVWHISRCCAVPELATPLPAVRYRMVSMNGTETKSDDMIEAHTMSDDNLRNYGQQGEAGLTCSPNM
jgi:hypothetical protein